jgi:hypothetical protein
LIKNLFFQVIKGTTSASIEETEYAGVSRMRKFQLLFVTCLISGLFVTSMAFLPKYVVASEVWHQTYGGSNDERAYSVIETSDGGFALAGYTYNYSAINRDFLLVKTDQQGNMLWNQTYGGNETDAAYSVVETGDGGFALTGRTDLGAGGIDFWLVRTDADGNMLWNKTYGGSDLDWAWSVVETGDGGFALAGDTESFGAGAWLVRTDAAGNLLWNQTCGVTEDLGLSSMIQTSDGGFALFGETYSSGVTDVRLVKTDSNGNLEWNQTYGGVEAYSLVQTGDGGYVLLVRERINDSLGIWLIKTDEDGNMIWNKQISTNKNISNNFASVIETSDGGYAANGDSWIIKTDVNGDVLFGEIPYIESFDAETGWYGFNFNCLLEVSNGNYVLAGYFDSGYPNRSDVLLVNFETDNDVPKIWDISRTEIDIENFTYTTFIEANVYDVNGLEEVILSYMVDDGSWNNVTMTNTEGNVYSAEIEAYPEGTDVLWTIIAENNIGKSSRINTESYSIIPEFPSWAPLLILLLSVTTLAVIYKRRIQTQGRTKQ